MPPSPHNFSIGIPSHCTLFDHWKIKLKKVQALFQKPYVVTIIMEDLDVPLNSSLSVCTNILTIATLQKMIQKSLKFIILKKKWKPPTSRVNQFTTDMTNLLFQMFRLPHWSSSKMRKLTLNYKTPTWYAPLILLEHFLIVLLGHTQLLYTIWPNRVTKNSDVISVTIFNNCNYKRLNCASQFKFITVVPIS